MIYLHGKDIIHRDLKSSNGKYEVISEYVFLSIDVEVKNGNASKMYNNCTIPVLDIIDLVDSIIICMNSTDM